MFSTALDEMRRENCSRRGSLSCPLLDHVVGASFRPGHVIEVTGEAGSGKTQLLVNALACSVTKEPVEGSASKSCQKEARSVVISTEGSFPAERLKQMIASFKSSSNQVDVRTTMDNILVHSLTSLDEFLDCLHVRLPKLAENYSLNLIVIDSVAAPLRSEEHTSGKERSQWIHTIGRAIHTLAVNFNVPVIMANQVSAVIDQGWETSYGHPVAPCFGLAFSAYVHTRIFVERTDQVIKTSNQEDKSTSTVRLRTAQVDFCPFLPSSEKVHFVVTSSGIRGVRVSE